MTRNDPEKVDLGARRPGIEKIVEEIMADKPKSSFDKAVALAKTEWHRRNDDEVGR